MNSRNNSIPNCHPELFRTPIDRGRAKVEPYVGTEESLNHHKRYWLKQDYLLDLRQLVPQLIPEFGHVLEVGCGMGHMHEHLGIQRGRYAGVDMNAAFLLEGRRHFPGITLVQGLADRLPFGARQFDHVICSDVLIHVADMVTALREIVRVSRGEVLLRLRTGDGSFQGSKMIYDPEQERLFSRVLLDGKWYYFYYNVVLEADIRAMLAHVGVRDFHLFDVSDGRDGRMATTKVFFKVPPELASISTGGTTQA